MRKVLGYGILVAIGAMAMMPAVEKFSEAMHCGWGFAALAVLGSMVLLFGSLTLAFWLVDP